MIYLFESELPENKSVFLSLVHIYGFGKSKSFFICKRLGFSRNFKVKSLSKEHVSKLIKTIEHLNLKLASDLKKSKLLSTKKLIAMKAYKGSRKIRGLPARGQRTHTNAKTSRKRFS
jgi:small subunit ribosomal protein S13